MDALSPSESPKGFFPNASNFSITRINRKIVGIILIVFAMGSGALLFAINARTQSVSSEEKGERLKADVATAPVLQEAKASSGGFIQTVTNVFSSQGSDDVVTDPEILKERAEFAKEMRRYEHQQQMQRMARRDNAYQSPMEARGAASSLPMSESPSETYEDGTARLERLPGGQLALGGGGGSMELGPDGALKDPNLQGRKEAYFNEDHASPYLPTRKEAARSPYEVKEGSVIPGVMISGINSDLPGQIIAQVSQNVYDSVSGQHLLIPQGTKMVGSYDSFVAVGQDSAMVAWRRLIFPDGMSLELLNMPGADMGGYAGFRDQVNNHYFRVFGGAIMMSFLGAGFQMTQPKPSGQYPSNQEIVAAEVSRNISQVGIELARRDMRIQPTIEIRPGYKFNIMVRRDMILEPYAG